VTPRRIVLSLLAGGLLLWLGWSALTLVSAAREAEQGLDGLDQLDGMSGSSAAEVVDRVVDGDEAGLDSDVVADLRASAEHFETASSKAGSPWLVPFEHVPVLGRQLRSVQSLGAAAATVSSSAADAFEEVDTALEGPFPDAAARVAAVRSVGDSLQQLRERVDRVDLGPLEGLVGPLASARDRFSDELATLQGALDEAAPAALGTATFLEGPSSYLFFAANNAEMRAGSGMYLQAGTLGIDRGTFSFSPLEATEDMVLAQPGAVLDPDVAANWAWVSPDREFRNVNVTPRFEESARMASEMWASSGRGGVDGVMVADVYALKFLLRAVGPVEVPGEDGAAAMVVTADDVVQQLLLDQYADQDDDRAARRESLGRVATAVLDALNTSEVPPLELLRAIDRAVSGRHLLLWSADPAQESAFEAIGADGKLHGDDLAVGLLNRGGNKLDQFVTSTVRVEPVGPPADDRQAYRMVVTLTNAAPEGLPTYVSGPHPRSTQPEGTWEGVVAVTLPAPAGAMATAAPLVVFGNDGPSRVVGMQVAVTRGATAELELTFDLPLEATTVELMASARPNPSQWQIGAPGSPSATALTDAQGQLVDLGTG
jgi:hypothetical protein